MSPALSAGARFAHRSNRNGTTDTICRQCFATVATAIWEADLDRAERTHTCDPCMLQSMKKPARLDRRPTLVHSRIKV